MAADALGLRPDRACAHPDAGAGRPRSSFGARARGGPRAAVRTVVGNATGVAGWAVLSALGVAALVAVSEAAFLTLKVVGVAVLVYLGVQALRGTRREAAPATDRRLLGEAFLTSSHESEAGRLLRRALPRIHPRGRAGAPAGRLRWPR